jgi:acyl-CoA thioesterase-1
MSRVIFILLSMLGAVLCGPVQSAIVPAPVILVFGDSLSAGYGINVDKGWVSLLSSRLNAEGYGLEVVNASVSGETSAGGLGRLPRALAAHRPELVLLELGANDGLRGLPVAGLRTNLQQMIGLAQKSGARVLLIGIRMPPNYGEQYTVPFAKVYEAVAEQLHVPLVPFLLAKVADKSELMQADGLHPNERGEPLLLENVWPKLLPLLRSASAASP